MIGAETLFVEYGHGQDPHPLSHAGRAHVIVHVARDDSCHRCTVTVPVGGVILGPPGDETPARQQPTLQVDVWADTGIHDRHDDVGAPGTGLPRTRHLHRAQGVLFPEPRIVGGLQRPHGVRAFCPGYAREAPKVVLQVGGPAEIRTHAEDSRMRQGFFAHQPEAADRREDGGHIGPFRHADRHVEAGGRSAAQPDRDVSRLYDARMRDAGSDDGTQHGEEDAGKEQTGGTSPVPARPGRTQNCTVAVPC